MPSVGGADWRNRVLQRSPEAFGFAPENDATNAEVRQLLYGTYRVLYTVRGQSVFILAVRHGARLFLRGEEIDCIK